MTTATQPHRTQSSLPAWTPLGVGALTSTTWAEHVLDLRHDQSEPLPQPEDGHLPGYFGRYVFDRVPANEPGLAHLAGWRVEFYNPTWPRETGFEAAVFVPPGMFKPRAAVVYHDQRPADRMDNKAIAKDHLGLSRTIGERIGEIGPSALRIPMTHAAISDPTRWLGEIDPADAQNPAITDPDVLRRLPMWVSPQWPTWASASAWITAGFDHPQRATIWRAEFSDARQAYGWRDATVGWPQQCRALADAGWTPLQGKRLSLALTFNAVANGLRSGQANTAKNAALTVITELTRTACPYRADPEKVLRCLNAGMGAQEIADLARDGKLDGLDDEVLTGMSAMRRSMEDSA